MMQPTSSAVMMVRVFPKRLLNSRETNGENLVILLKGATFMDRSLLDSKQWLLADTPTLGKFLLKTYFNYYR